MSFFAPLYRSALLATLFAVTIGLAGCGPRLSFQNMYRIESGYIKTVILDPIGAEQTITVRAVSEGNVFRVHVYLEKDEADAELAIARQQTSDKLIASSASGTEATLKATIPADQAAVLRLEATSSKTVNLSVNITN